MRKTLLVVALAFTVAGVSQAEPSSERAWANQLNHGATPAFKEFKELKERIAKAGASALAWRGGVAAKQVTRDSSWEEIAKASGVKAKFPGFMVGAQWTPVTGFCVKGGQVHASYTERVCDGHIVEGRDGDTRCQGRSFQEAWVYATRLVAFPGAAVRECAGRLAEGRDGDIRCQGSGFQEAWVTVNKPIPLSYPVDVVSVSEGRDGDLREGLLFVKEYALGSCR